MAMFTAAGANAALDHIFGGVAYGNANWYFALGTNTLSSPGDAVTEVSTDNWTNYARDEVVRNQTNFPAASAKAMANGAALDFGTATIPSGTVTVKCIGIYTASTSGTLHASVNLTAEKVINNGDPVTVPIGDLDITMA